MENIFLSVVIPSYNPDFNEFKRCISSVNHFSFPYEIVVVDDGSHEEIAAECESYMKKQEHASFYRKENGGESSARNFGIEQCCGRYVLFIDVDDALSEEFVIYLNENYKKLAADWILCGFEVRNIEKRMVQYKGIVGRKDFYQTNDIFDVNFDYALQLLAEGREICECWAKLVKRELLVQHSIRFPLGMRSGEDYRFNVRLMEYVNTVQCIPVYGYIYYYIPKLAQRVLKNPSQRYIHYFEGKKELEALIRRRAAPEKAAGLMKKQKSVITVNLVQDCFILIKAKKLDKEMKEEICGHIKQFGLFNNFRLWDCPDVKSRCYYFFLKRKLWAAMHGIVLLKQILGK